MSHYADTNLSTCYHFYKMSDKENSFLPASSHKLFSLSMALLIAYAHYIMKQSFMIVIYTRFTHQSLLYRDFFTQ